MSLDSNLMKHQILTIREFLSQDDINKDDIVDILLVFLSKTHLNSLSELIKNGYSIEEIKDIEVYK
tara:strand:+ start:197 stop:394 length:198 start_codon:yes stop_codon:yes gene_type:complete